MIYLYLKYFIRENLKLRGKYICFICYINNFNNYCNFFYFKDLLEVNVYCIFIIILLSIFILIYFL